MHRLHKYHMLYLMRVCNSALLYGIEHLFVIYAVFENFDHSFGVHSSKRIHLYEKRRISSRSPINRRMTPDSRNISHRKRISPHVHSSRVSSQSMSPVSSSSHYTSSPKKKVRREAHISSESRLSPPLEKSHAHVLSEAHISHKVSSSIPSTYSHNRGRAYPSSSRVSRPSYPLPERPREGYDGRQKAMMVNMEPSYTQMEHKRSRERRDDYLSDRTKHYALTLDERFRSVNDDSARDDQRVQFSREDLENITIDIKRNLRDFSPTIRRIVDPTEVKLVRRVTEGHRPIFDREEIKQSVRDMREDAYNEQKFYAGGDHGRSGVFVLNYKEMENYEITRHRFESHSVQSHSTNAPTLSDKWRRLESQKQPSTSLDTDERNHHGYSNRPRSPPPYVESRRMHRARSADRDFRPIVEHRSRPEYPPPSQKPLPINPADLRHSLSVRRKDGSVHDARERIIERRGSEHLSDSRSEARHYHPMPPKYSSSGDCMRERSRSNSRVRRIEPRGHVDSPVRARSVDRLRLKDDRPPDFSRPPDRYKYPSWSEKPSASSRSLGYYEHDDREGSDIFYMRGNSRGFRGRGFRGRFFRGGPSRGIGFRGRGTFRSSLSPRGRSYPPRRGRFSPGRWKHDLFAKVSDDGPSGSYPSRNR